MGQVDAMRLFNRLAERKSFSAAAADLELKQSTASKWVAELEARLGVGLVDTAARGRRLADGRRVLVAHLAASLATKLRAAEGGAGGGAAGARGRAPRRPTPAAPARAARR
ncbi:MAG TPA: LysR family transcriptional regulator [Polyangiaceae bacterium]|nr:LysR family transcriptional regulator [Polyangiaceae bacterium]